MFDIYEYLYTVPLQGEYATKGKAIHYSFMSKQIHIELKGRTTFD